MGQTATNRGILKIRVTKAVEEKVIVVEDNSPDPKYWMQYIGKGSNEACSSHLKVGLQIQLSMVTWFH